MIKLYGGSGEGGAGGGSGGGFGGGPVGGAGGGLDMVSEPTDDMGEGTPDLNTGSEAQPNVSTAKSDLKLPENPQSNT